MWRILLSNISPKCLWAAFLFSSSMHDQLPHTYSNRGSTGQRKDLHLQETDTLPQLDWCSDKRYKAHAMWFSYKIMICYGCLNSGQAFFCSRCVEYHQWLILKLVCLGFLLPQSLTLGSTDVNVWRYTNPLSSSGQIMKRGLKSGSKTYIFRWPFKIWNKTTGLKMLRVFRSSCDFLSLLGSVHWQLSMTYDSSSQMKAARWR